MSGKILFTSAGSSFSNSLLADLAKVIAYSPLVIQFTLTFKALPNRWQGLARFLFPLLRQPIVVKVLPQRSASFQINQYRGFPALRIHNKPNTIHFFSSISPIVPSEILFRAPDLALQLWRLWRRLEAMVGSNRLGGNDTTRWPQVF